MKKTMPLAAILPVILIILSLFACVSESSATKEDPVDQIPEYVWDGTTNIEPEQAYYYTDINDGGSSENTGSYADGVFVLKGTVTTQFEYGFIGGGFDLEMEEKNLLTVAKGIKFKTRGNGKNYRCRLSSKKVKDYDYHGYIFTTDEEEREIVILYKDLTQEGWGAGVLFDKKDVFQISFQSVGQPHENVYLEVYDIEIIPEEE